MNGKRRVCPESGWNCLLMIAIQDFFDIIIKAKSIERGMKNESICDIGESWAQPHLL